MEIRLKKYFPAVQIESNPCQQDQDPEGTEKFGDQVAETKESVLKTKSDVNLRSEERPKNSILPLSMKNKSLHWKTRATIGMDMSDNHYNQITKRLYSLLNGNDLPNELRCPMLAGNRENDSVATAALLGKDKIFLKEEITKNENLSDINHNKLRGFLKQISVEKSGLSTIKNINIVNKSSIKKQNAKDFIKKLKVKDREFESVKNDPPESKHDEKNISPAEDIEKDDLKIGENKNLKELQRTNKIKREAEDHTNKNYSNCGETADLSRFFHKISHKTSSMSAVKTNESPPTEKVDQIGKESESSSLEKVSNKVDSNHADESESNLNFYLKMIGKIKEKHHSRNFSKLQNQNFKICSNQKKYQDTLDHQESTNSIKGDTPTNKCHQSHTCGQDSARPNVLIPDKEGRVKSDSKIVFPNKGDCESKHRCSFSEKIIRIFTKSGHLSKRKKLIETSLETVERIGIDNLIHLVNILSVELILNTLQNKSNQEKSVPKSEMIKKAATDSLSINNKVTGSSPDAFRNASKNQIIVPPHPSFHNYDSSRKSELIFDFNGRVVKNPPVDNGSCSHHYLRGSMSNLDYQAMKNSSMYSIPSGSRVLKVANLSHDFNAPTRISSVDNFKERPDNDSSVNSKRTRFKQTFQLSFGSENHQTNGKRDNQRLYERSPYKSTCSVFGDNNGYAGKPGRNNVKNSGPQNRLVDFTFPIEVTESGGYRFSAQIKSKLDFMKVDEVFDLKEQLYNECSRSTVYIRQKSLPPNSRLHHPGNRGITNWILHIESPTRATLKSSLGIVASRFPEWNLQHFLT